MYCSQCLGPMYFDSGRLWLLHLANIPRAYLPLISLDPQELGHSKKPNRGTLKPCRSTIEQMRVMEGPLAGLCGKIWQWQRHKPGDTWDNCWARCFWRYSRYLPLVRQHEVAALPEKEQHCVPACVLWSIQDRHSNRHWAGRETKMSFLRWISGMFCADAGNGLPYWCQRMVLSEPCCV